MSDLGGLRFLGEIRVRLERVGLCEPGRADRYAGALDLERNHVGAIRDGRDVLPGDVLVRTGRVDGEHPATRGGGRLTAGAQWRQRRADGALELADVEAVGQ